MYNISFHITDHCNLRCNDCHWFSSEIKISEEIPFNDYINFINNNINNISKIRITGGEPTLYKDFTELINNIPNNINVMICSNGTNIEKLKTIKRNVSLMISINRIVNDDFKNEIKLLGFPVMFQTYLGNNPSLKNELEYGECFKNLNILNKNCMCYTKAIRFASDGYAYNCELGLRTKDENLRTGFSIWNGEINKNPLSCLIKQECFSNFVNENIYNLIN